MHVIIFIYMLHGEGVCKLDNLFPIRLLYIMQINMFKLKNQKFQSKIDSKRFSQKLTQKFNAKIVHEVALWFCKQINNGRYHLNAYPALYPAKIVRLMGECLNQSHNGDIYRPRVHLSGNNEFKILINWF